MRRSRNPTRPQHSSQLQYCQKFTRFFFGKGNELASGEMASRTAKRLKRALLKNCEHSVHAELQKRHRRRDDPAYDERQDDQRQIMGPIRFVMMNQGHIFLPCEFF